MIHGERRTFPPVFSPENPPASFPARGTQRIKAKRLTQPYGTPPSTVLRIGPEMVRADKVITGMTVRARKRQKNSRPRPINVDAIGWCTKKVTVDGKVVEVPAIFFNGKLNRTFLPSEELYLLFDPTRANNGNHTDVLQFREDSTPAEVKAENRARHQQEREILAALTGEEAEPAPVEALIDVSKVPLPKLPEFTGEFKHAYQAEPDPVAPPEVWDVRCGTPHETDRSQRKLPPAVRLSYDAHVKAYAQVQEQARRDAELDEVMAKFGK